MTTMVLPCMRNDDDCGVRQGDGLPQATSGSCLLRSDKLLRRLLRWPFVAALGRIDVDGRLACHLTTHQPTS